jgi:hypothetical protein
LERGPTNPGNHQTAVFSVGERTSNGCQRRFDSDVGFGCSRNTPPTALERRSRWNAGIKVCDNVHDIPVDERLVKAVVAATFAAELKEYE